MNNTHAGPPCGDVKNRVLSCGNHLLWKQSGSPENPAHQKDTRGGSYLIPMFTVPLGTGLSIDDDGPTMYMGGVNQTIYGALSILCYK